MSSQVVTSRFDDWTSTLTLSCNYRFSIELSLGQLFAMMMAIFNRSRRWRKLTNKIMQNYCKVSNFPAREWNGKENLCSAFSFSRPQWVCVNKEWALEMNRIKFWKFHFMHNWKVEQQNDEAREEKTGGKFSIQFFIFDFPIFTSSQLIDYQRCRCSARTHTQTLTAIDCHRFNSGVVWDRKFDFNWIFTQFLLLKNLRNLNRFYMAASLSESFRVWLADSQYIHACVFLLCVECDWLALLSRLVCFNPLAPNFFLPFAQECWKCFFHHRLTTTFTLCHPGSTTERNQVEIVWKFDPNKFSTSNWVTLKFLPRERERIESNGTQPVAVARRWRQWRRGKLTEHFHCVEWKREI